MKKDKEERSGFAGLGILICFLAGFFVRPAPAAFLYGIVFVFAMALVAAIDKGK